MSPNLLILGRLGKQGAIKSTMSSPATAHEALKALNVTAAVRRDTPTKQHPAKHSGLCNV